MIFVHKKKNSLALIFVIIVFDKILLINVLGNMHVLKETLFLTFWLEM